MGVNASGRYLKHSNRKSGDNMKPCGTSCFKSRQRVSQCAGECPAGIVHPAICCDLFYIILTHGLAGSAPVIEKNAIKPIKAAGDIFFFLILLTSQDLLFFRDWTEICCCAVVLISSLSWKSVKTAAITEVCIGPGRMASHGNTRSLMAAKPREA